MTILIGGSRDWWLGCAAGHITAVLYFYPAVSPFHLTFSPHLHFNFVFHHVSLHYCQISLSLLLTTLLLSGLLPLSHYRLIFWGKLSFYVESNNWGMTVSRADKRLLGLDGSQCNFKMFPQNQYLHLFKKHNSNCNHRRWNQWRVVHYTNCHIEER